MDVALLHQAAELLEKVNANLEPNLIASEDAPEVMAVYARIERLGAFGVTALSARVKDAASVAKIAGTSMGKAKETVATASVMGSSVELASAMQHGEVSLDQAAQIAKAEASSPGAAAGLVEVAKTEGFHVLKDKARKVKLEAEQHRGLGERQREARRASSHIDELGMINVHLRWQPHIGAPLVARAETQAARLFKAARKKGDPEPFERYLADAYAELMTDSQVKGHSKRSELVVVVSHEVADRGWVDVREGEVCKIPGVGPIDPHDAKAMARDAFITAVVSDGVDLRQLKRWTRNTPIEVRIALELGDPPGFDGIRCVDCGNRFRNEMDHNDPHCRKGPASNTNLKPRCWSCHQAKTTRDRKAGKLKPGAP